MKSVRVSSFLHNLAVILFGGGLVLAIVLSNGCKHDHPGESSSTTSTSSGTSGSTGDTTSSSTSTSSSDTTTTTLLCGSATLAPFDCATAYPDATVAYDPAASNLYGFGPAQGETPDGGAAGRVDVTSGVVQAVLIRFYAGIPSDVQVAVWQEPTCGLPSQSPPWQSVSVAAITTADGVSRLPLAAPTTLAPAAGYTWVAIRLTGDDVLVWTVPTTAGAHEPRFAWLGLADKDCDGANDAQLGWEDIRTPSAVGVDAADVDLTIGVELM